MPAKHDADTVSYLIRAVPGDIWRAARVRAVMERRTIADVIVSLLREYGEGEPTKIAATQRSTKRKRS